MQGTGLFHNFFFHKVVVAIFFGGFYVPSDFFHLFFHQFQIAVEHLYAVAGKFYDFPFIQMVDCTGIGQNGRNIRCHKVAFVRQTHNQGRSVAHCNKAIFILVADNAQSIRTFQHIYGFLYRLQQIPFVMFFQQVADDFAVGFGSKSHTVSHQSGFQFAVIFNNAVMYNGKRPALGQMGMRVFIRGLAVGSPTSMTNPQSRSNGVASVNHITQHLQTTFGLVHTNGALFHTGDAGRVIATVFQSCQTVQQNGSYLFFPYISNNSAHGRFTSVS